MVTVFRTDIEDFEYDLRSTLPEKTRKAVHLIRAA